jgi:hypothetical protein
VEVLVHLGLQGPLDDHLGDPVRDCRHASRSRSSIALRSVDPSHWRRGAAPRCQPIPKLVAVVLHIPLTLRHRLPVYSSRALGGFDALIRLPDLAFGHTAGFCFIHQVPPLAG